jgi:formylmethanofuran dehydrogenase subunit B
MTEASNLYYQNNKERIKQYAKNLYLKKKAGKTPTQKRKKYNTFKNNETAINKSIEILKQEKRIILFFD